MSDKEKQALLARRCRDFAEQLRKEFPDVSVLTFAAAPDSNANAVTMRGDDIEVANAIIGSMLRDTTIAALIHTSSKMCIEQLAGYKPIDA